MSSSSVPADDSLPQWEREALRDTTWKIEKQLEKFTNEEAEAIIVRHGGYTSSPFPSFFFPPPVLIVYRLGRW